MGGAILAVFEAESERYSARYGARHPWLVPWPLAGLYLIWRGLVAGLRPVLFLVLVAASITSAGLLVQSLPRFQPPPPPLSQRIDAAVFDALEPSNDRHRQWVNLLDQSLQASPRTIPDIDLARSIATSYIAMRGEEALALELLSESRRVDLVEAELRALPAWQRGQVLSETIERQLMQGADMGFRPTTLVFAPANLQNRLARAEQLYAPTLVEAERWFVDPDARALALDALPGITPRRDRIYDDVRDVVVQGCAFAGQSGRPTGQCRVGFLPKPPPDPILAGLALAVAGAEPQRRSGARLAKAAWAAGQLDPELAERLAFGTNAELGRAAVLASSSRLMVDAGEVWTQPNRFERLARMASEEAARAAEIDIAWRNRVFDSLTGLRREVGALSALRMTEAVSTAQEVEHLEEMARVGGGQLLALQSIAGPEFIDRVGLIDDRRRSRLRSVVDWPQRAQQFLALSLLFAFLAVCVPGLSLLGGRNRKRTKRPGAFERLDGAISRLILGRNL